MALAVLFCSSPRVSLSAEDCNGNGMEDALDIADGTSADCDEDGVPDECVLRPGISFASSTLIRVGTKPNSSLSVEVVTGDFNGDGLVDSASTHTKSAEVGILLGKGGGEFEDIEMVRVLHNPRGIGTADLDHDGDLDLPVSHPGGGETTGHVTVLENDGDGGFTVAQVLDVDWPPLWMEVGDYDGDGFADLVVTDGSPTRTGHLHLLRNDDGYLREADSIDLSAIGSQMWGICLGDLDLDGDVDIITAPDFNLTILENLGGGVFAEPRFYDGGPYPSRTEIGDIDGDGFMDIVVPNTDAALIRILFGAAEDPYSESIDIRSIWSTKSAQIADMNGDGRPDLVVPGARELNVLLNEGGRVFGEPTRYASGGALKPAIGDLDGNGTPDVITGRMSEGWDQLSVLWNPVGDGDLISARVYYTWGGLGYSPWRSVWGVGGDFDLDGDLDLAIAVQRENFSLDEGILLPRNDGTGDFSELWFWTLGVCPKNAS